jgi:DNA-binding transcriptional ArsR family regulator
LSNRTVGDVLELDVIDDPHAAITALDPVRAQILRQLAEPGSATTVANEMGLSRQKVNYHLRALEAHGLVELVEERPRRGLTERIVQATARAYLVAPDVVDEHAVDPSRLDRLSSRYLLALAGRLVKEVVDLTRRADQAGKELPTLAIDADIKFRSAAERAAFTTELAAVVRDLAARYHDEAAPRGRWHRLVVAAHPRPALPVQSSQDRGEP